MGLKRLDPYVWTMWLPKLLVGEDSCEWAVWFKANHEQYDKVPSTYDQAAWQLQHKSKLIQVQEELENTGYTIFIEHYFTYSKYS